MLRSIGGVICKFWWGKSGDRRKIHLLAWDDLTLPMRQGGVGLVRMEKFSKALLAKQFWHVLHNPESLLAKFMINKYGKGQVGDLDKSHSNMS